MSFWAFWADISAAAGSRGVDEKMDRKKFMGRTTGSVRVEDAVVVVVVVVDGRWERGEDKWTE